MAHFIEINDLDDEDVKLLETLAERLRKKAGAKRSHPKESSENVTAKDALATTKINIIQKETEKKAALTAKTANRQVQTGAQQNPFTLSLTSAMLASGIWDTGLSSH